MAGEDPEMVEINPGQTVAVRVKDGKVTHMLFGSVWMNVANVMRRRQSKH